MKIEDLTIIFGMLEELRTIKEQKPPSIGFKKVILKKNDITLKNIDRLQTAILTEKINQLSKKPTILDRIKGFIFDENTKN